MRVRVDLAKARKTVIKSITFGNEIKLILQDSKMEGTGQMSEKVSITGLTEPEIMEAITGTMVTQVETADGEWVPVTRIIIYENGESYTVPERALEQVSMKLVKTRNQTLVLTYPDYKELQEYFRKEERKHHFCNVLDCCDTPAEVERFLKQNDRIDKNAEEYEERCLEDITGEDEQAALNKLAQLYGGMMLYKFTCPTENGIEYHPVILCQEQAQLFEDMIQKLQNGETVSKVEDVWLTDEEERSFSLFSAISITPVAKYKIGYGLEE